MRAADDVARRALRARPLLGIAAAWLVAAQIAGATPAVRPFPPQEYGGNSQVFTIARRADGPMLFSTIGGIVEYDGERWRHLELPGTQLALAVDDTGRIWTAGTGQLGTVEADATGSPRFRSLLDELPGSPDFSETWPILPTPEGVFFASREWLFRWHDGAFTSWPGDRDHVFYRLYLVHGRIFVAQFGVGLLEWVDGELRPIEAPELPEEAELNFMFGTEGGDAVVLTRRHGAFRYDGERLDPFDPPAESWLIEQNVQHGCELPDGRLVIASIHGGIGLFDRALDAAPQVIDEQADLPDDLVHFVFAGDEGELWAGTNNGIARIEIGSSADRLGVAEGIEGFVGGLLRRPSDLWVAAASGLFVDLDGVEPYRFEKVDVPEPAWSVVDVGGGVLAATSDGVFEIGIRRDDALTLIVPRQVHGEGATELFPVPGRPDEVLSSLENGLGWFVREAGGWRWHGRVPGVASEPRIAVEGPDGELIAWSPARERLLRLVFGPEPRSPPEVRTHDLGESGLLTRLGDRTVFQRAGRLERYLGVDAEGWPFEPDPELAKLAETLGSAPFVLHQDGGLLWLATADGLRFAEPTVDGGYRVRPIDAEGIAPVVQVVDDVGHDQHFLTTADGVYLYRPPDRQTAPPPLRVLVRSLEVPGVDNGLLYGGLGPTVPFVLPADADDLRLELAASRLETEPIEYQLRLDDGEWSAWDDAPTRDLTEFGYGDHVVQVRARDAWGTLSGVEALPLRVPWPWWLAPWAIGLWTVLVVGLVTTAVRLRTRQLDAERTRLEKVVAERTRSLAERSADLEQQTRALETANQRLAEENEHRRQLELERRKLEARVEQSKKLESLGLMAGGIAHDFNNILMAVLGNADLGLESKGVPPAVESRLRDIRSAAWQAAELCRQMLAYAGKRQIRHAEVDLSRLAEECLATVRMTADPEVRFSIDLPASLPAVHGDASQLRQVVTNLLSNATEAFDDGAPGTVSLSVEQRRIDPSDSVDTLLAEPLPAGSYLVLRVLDDGIGMDEETRRRIFDPFFTTKFTGRGLGLAATLGIVRAHQGTLRVESRPGEGTRVEVFLPALDHVAEKPAAESSERPSRDRLRGGGTVLVVDDEAIVRDVAALMLGNAGFEVIAAENGERGVELFEQHHERIATVLLDLTMPGLDGVETFRRMRRVDPEVVAILSSGYSADDIAERYVELGFASFLHKPYQAATLRRAVRAALDGRATREPSEDEADDPDDQEAGSSSGAKVSSTGT